MGTKHGSLNSIRREIQKTHLILIVIITILISTGATVININANARSIEQNLAETSILISKIYGFSERMTEDELIEYFNSLSQQLPDVDVISIVSSDGIRLYHTNNSLIRTVYDGKKPNQGDSSPLQIFKETGPSGPQHRIYRAIYREGKYCGFIMTIILDKSIRSSYIRVILLFIFVTIGAIVVEIFISGTLSRRIKQRLHGYEPDTFLSMFMIRDNILESIDDGIFAVDDNENIAFLNGVARRILYCDDDKLNLINERIFIQKFLKRTLKTGEYQYGLREKTNSGIELLIDCIPVKQNESICGAVAILHDQTEYTRLMEDLSGAKYLVDSMRANNHDFTNKLHVILGLIQIGEYEKAVSYIENISIIQRETISRVMHSIDNPSIAALLIGKIARASECNIKFILKEELNFKQTDIHLPSEALVTITGNLIENAIDSMNIQSLADASSRELIFGISSRPGELIICVEDRGCGIADDIKEKIFENGFSTKGEGRGVGLYHTKQLVESLGGSISFESSQMHGSCFLVTFSDKGDRVK